MTGFYADLLGGNSKAACAALTPNALGEIRAEFGFDVLPCGELMDFLNTIWAGERREPYRTLRIRRVTVTGDRALVANGDRVLPAKIRSPRPARSSRLVKRDGRWRLDHIAG